MAEAITLQEQIEELRLSLPAFKDQTDRLEILARGDPKRLARVELRRSVEPSLAAGLEILQALASGRPIETGQISLVDIKAAALQYLASREREIEMIEGRLAAKRWPQVDYERRSDRLDILGAAVKTIRGVPVDNGESKDPRR